MIRVLRPWCGPGAVPAIQVRLPDGADKLDLAVIGLVSPPLGGSGDIGNDMRGAGHAVRAVVVDAMRKSPRGRAGPA
jgi:hypothetical protein